MLDVSDGPVRSAEEARRGLPVEDFSLGMFIRREGASESLVVRVGNMVGILNVRYGYVWEERRGVAGGRGR